MKDVFTKRILGLALTAALSACGGGGDNSEPVGNQQVGTVQPTQPVLSSTPIRLVSGTTLGTTFWPSGSTSSGGRGQAIGGVNCLINENYHIHTHLAIIKNGESLAIPANVGLQGCAYELHTHDQSGILHVETATPTKFTLGQFFAVWGQPLSRSNVAGITDQPVKIYINDGENLQEFQGNPADVEFSNHRSITIQIGTPLSQIPSYVWDSSL
jgi:hypothetical protein